MKFYLHIICTLTLLFSGCLSESDNLNIIDYDSLNNIEVEISKEIGENDHYIPGVFRDLILTTDETLLVSDWGKTTIEQFNTSGEHVGTIAGKGRGPGELSSFFLLFEGKNESLIVRHRGTTQQMDYFEKGKNGLYQFNQTTIHEQVSDRFATLIGPTSESGYIALSTPVLSNLQALRSDFQNYSHTPVVILDELENILQDSLHFLKTPNPHTEITASGGMMVYGLPPYQSHDRLQLMEDGHYVIARPDSAAIFFYNRNHELEKRVSLNVKNRPVERSDLDYLFESINAGQDVRRIMEARVPEIKPPFLNIWVSRNNILLHTDTSAKGKQMVLLNNDGEPEGIFYLSEFDDIRYFRGQKIYVLHKNQDLGHIIRIYRI